MSFDGVCDMLGVWWMKPNMLGVDLPRALAINVCSGAVDGEMCGVARLGLVPHG
jgi:hypothetical protein